MSVISRNLGLLWMEIWFDRRLRGSHKEERREERREIAGAVKKS